ncbi:MAG: serine hydrolase domain-containing protein [Acidimicrobiia bacterium]
MTRIEVSPVTDPTELGIDEAAWAALMTRARAEVDSGLLPSCQLALARDGRAVAITLGDAAPNSRYVIFSATKPVVASAVWKLIGSGAIDVSRPVADYIPEFGTEGKEGITIEQVMLHTSGFPHAPFVPVQWDDRTARLERFGAWRCNWEPGTRFEYHPTSAHWVLAELIERAAERDFREYVQTEILDEIGLTQLRVGVPAEQQGDINELVNTGEPATRDELMAVLGIPELPLTEVTPEALLSFNAPAVRAVGVPGGGGVSTAADLALFYQALLHDPAGIWDPSVLDDVKTNVRNSFPDFLGTPANRTLGLVLAGDDGRSNYRGMGKTVSPGTFGHNGAGGQIAWADPATGLSFAYLTNGMDQHPLRQARRNTAIASRAAVCVTA